MITIHKKENEKKKNTRTIALVWQLALLNWLCSTVAYQCKSKLQNLKENLNVFFSLFLTSYLKFSPPSATGYCSPSLSPETKFFKWLTSNTCHSSSSVCLLNGSRFSRRFPENNTGSCREKLLNKYY